jgi:hypothetical protein
MMLDRDYSYSRFLRKLISEFRCIEQWVQIPADYVRLATG